MTYPTCDDSVSWGAPPVGVAAPTLALRIVQPGSAERMTMLSQGKHTVGSSQRCQIHLSSQQIRPLHCLIVHGANETVVTRWAAGALLNGQEFTTAPLSAGDCLSLGDVELHVVDPEKVPLSPSKTREPESEDDSRQPVTGPQVNPLREASQTARARCRKLVGAMRGLRSQVVGFEQKIEQLEQQHQGVWQEREQLAAALQRFQTEAAQRDQQASEETDRLITELTSAFEKAESAEAVAAQQTSRLEQLEIDLAAAQEQRDQLEEARAAGAQAVADRDRSLEAVQAELERLQAERDELRAAQAEQHTHQHEWEEALAERDRRLAAKQKEYEGLIEVLQTFEHGVFEETETRNRQEIELAEMRAECDHLRKVKTQDEERATELEQQLQQSCERTTALELQLKESAERRDQLAADLEQLHSRCEQLSVEQLSTEQQKEQLQIAFTDYQQTIDELNERLTSADEKRQELEEALATGTTTNQQLQVELAQLLERYEALEKQRAQESRLHQEAQQQLAEGRQNSERYEVDLQNLRAELNSTQEKSTQLEAELAAAQQQVTTLSHELEASISAGAEAEASETQQRVALLEEEKASLLEQVKEQQGRADRLAAQLAQLDARQQQTQSELSEARQDLVAAKEALHAQASHPADLETKLPPESVLPAALAPGEKPLTTNEAAPVGSLSPKEDYFSAPTKAQESAEEYRPTSFIEQYAQLMEEDGDVSGEQPVPATPGSPPSSELTDESEDAALEDYMVNMMNRMRGEPNHEDRAAHPNISRTSQLRQDRDPLAAVDQVVRQVSASAQATESIPSEPLDLETLKQSSHKPALPTDLAAMRALANNSARKAIAKHHIRRHLEKAFGSFLVCLIATAVGVYMMLTTEYMLTPQFCGGAAATLIGAMGGGKLFGLLLRAVREGSWEYDVPAEIPVETETLPIDGVAETAGEE
ncbi:MAG: hypothetical protein MI725_11080 [Pirellulales bacterium]|nr:hypothetical protein [Pirellulales bacterium]